MLEPDMKAQLGEYLERLVAPVEINAHVDDSRASKDMLALLADITSLTPKVTLSGAAAAAVACTGVYHRCRKGRGLLRAQSRIAAVG